MMNEQNRSESGAESGRMVVEAAKDAAKTGWVTADSIKGVYAKDSDGKTKNIFS
jgi:hypothetical protein